MVGLRHRLWSHVPTSSSTRGRGVSRKVRSFLTREFSPKLNDYISDSFAPIIARFGHVLRFRFGRSQARGPWAGKLGVIGAIRVRFPVVLPRKQLANRSRQSIRVTFALNVINSQRTPSLIY